MGPSDHCWVLPLKLKGEESAQKWMQDETDREILLLAHRSRIKVHVETLPVNHVQGVVGDGEGKGVGRFVGAEKVEVQTDVLGM